jgi:IS6 family transposase
MGGLGWAGSAAGVAPAVGGAFSRHEFPDDVTARAVRWDVRYRSRYADVVEWLAERGVAVDRSTVFRRVRRFSPLFAEAARAQRRAVGGTWRVGETYGRLGGRWACRYRAIDEHGPVVDVHFSQRRNAAAAEAFLRRAIGEVGVTPVRVTIDKARRDPPALKSVLPDVEHRSSRCRNNGVERDHGHRKQRLRPLRGFQRAASADAVTRGHGLVRNLQNGFSALTATVAPALRLAAAWPRLAALI